MDIKQIETVNKFANIEQTYNSKKREFCKHTTIFVKMDVFDANIPKIFNYIKKKRF
jgi:hypothetical protein